MILGLTGIVYGFLSPDFGLNSESLVLFVSLAIGLGIVTYLKFGGTSLLAISRHRAKSDVRLYGTAVGVAIACVLASRLIGFAPGVVYGFIASTVVVAPVALSRRQEAQLVLWPDLALLALAIAAWLALGPVSAAAATDGGVLLAIANTVLATLFVAGLEGFMLCMIPLRFVDGAAVMRWNRWLWALIFGVGVFLWWQLLINRDEAYVDAFRQGSVLAALAILAIFMIVTGSVWLYFRTHTLPEPKEAEA